MHIILNGRTALTLVCCFLGCSSPITHDLDPDAGAATPSADGATRPTRPDRTTCALALSESDEVLVTESLEVTAGSNGDACTISIGGGPKQPIACDGTAVLDAADLGIGIHDVVLSVDDGPSGPASCDAQAVVKYPGPCHLDHDLGLDGSIDQRDILVYDTGGRHIRTDIDRGLDGSIDAQRRYILADGLRVQEDVDDPMGGAIDARLHFEHDDSGLLRTHRRDDGVDGSIDAVSTYAYDASGRRSKRDDDDGANGTIDHRLHFVREANGHLSALELDEGVDGTIDLRLTFQNNAVGQPDSRTHDDGADGDLEVHTTYSYECW